MVAGDPAKFEKTGGGDNAGGVYRAARFVLSATRLSQLPSDSEREVAFAGRSNAGKSSVINTLAHSGRLARISKTPGRTQALNCFALAPGHYLVDLPGYGYAKVSQAQRRHWHGELGRYFRLREALAGLVLVLDIRRGVTDLDWQMIEFLGPRGTALHCLLNKADKLSANAAHNTLHNVKRELAGAGVTASAQLFSATRSRGAAECYAVLDDWLQA